MQDNHTRTDARDNRIEELRGYVEAIVGKISRAMGLPPSLRDDLIGAGYIGLVEASDRFDAERGADFKGYASLRIRGSVIDYIRSCCNVSGKAYRMLKALEAANDARINSVEPESGSQGKRLAHTLEYLALSSFSYRLTNLGVGAQEHAMVPTPEQELEKNQNSKILQDLVATLPEKERMIIEQYYFHGKMFIEIADEDAGLSKSWISRLHTRALEMLKNRYMDAIRDPAPAADGGVPGTDSKRRKRKRSKSHRKPAQ